MKKTALSLLFFLSLIVQSAELKFETADLDDRKFLESQKTWLQEQYAKLEQYFATYPHQPVLLQVLPVERNLGFKSCARIYGPYRIYAHSPKSLNSLPVDKRQGINFYCFNRDYNDLKYTMVHEYIHSLSLLLTHEKTISKWIWEGSAVALSGELDSTGMKQDANNRLKKLQIVDPCKEQIADGDAYMIAGPLLKFYEKKHPNFVRELLSELANSSSFDLQKFIISKGLQCSVKAKDLAL